MAFLVLTGHPGWKNDVSHVLTLAMRIFSYLVPVADAHSLAVSNSNLRTEEGKLSRVESLVCDLAELHRKVGTGNGAHMAGDVRGGGVESGQRSIPEIITLCYRLDQIQRSVARANDGDRAGSDCGAVEGCQPASSTQGFQSADNVRPCLGAVCLHIDPEIQSLAR